MSWSYEFPLVGGGGEPIDLWRTFVSHGVTELPPMAVDEDAKSFEVTLRVARGARAIRVAPGRAGYGVATVSGRAPGPRAEAEIGVKVRYVLRLDDDLSDFYAKAADDPDLAWVGAGAGRMVRSATVFEEVVKTICTTNCSWSATRRMVGALVDHLGEQAQGSDRRAFPTPEAMAGRPARFYVDTVRAGYRARYLRDLARSIADGSRDLESWDDLPDADYADRLLALPGIGPYAMAHILLLRGRYSRLIFDSWTRPTYARLRGRRSKDSTIERRFRRYGEYAGLAFWLYITRNWVSEPP